MKALERTILSVLQDAHPAMMKGTRLYYEVNVAHSAAVTRADFERAMVNLQQKEGGAQVTGVTGDDDTKWKITAEGLSRLSE